MSDLSALPDNILHSMHLAFAQEIAKRQRQADLIRREKELTKLNSRRLRKPKEHTPSYRLARLQVNLDNAPTANKFHRLGKIK